MQMTVDLEITGYKPTQYFSFRVNSGPFPVEIHYTSASRGNTTEVIGRREPQPNGIWKVLTPIFSIPARRKFEGELHNLKGYLESN